MKALILMGTLNGANHLGQQLASFLDQDHKDWTLWVSDDGSTDATRELIQKFASEHPDRAIRLFDGPRQGMVANYLSLIDRVGTEFDWVFLSDQDDVWLPHKLSRALEALKDVTDRPAAYGASSYQTDAELNVMGEASLPPEGDFRNALTQNVLAGNTLLLNRRAIQLLQKAGTPARAVFHDWWIYLLITGAGGEIRLDPKPVLYYRQHGQNRIGARRGMAAFVQRWRLFRDGRYTDWLDGNLMDLAEREALLNEDARKRLAEFQFARECKGLRSLKHLRKSEARRGSALGQFMLQLFAGLGRL